MAAKSGEVFGRIRPPRVPVVSDQPDEASSERWRSLMTAAQVGDATAYRRLLCEVAPWLRAVYARRLQPCLTEDAVQDALLAIHEKRHTYDPALPFGPWLAAIAYYRRTRWLPGYLHRQTIKEHHA